MTKMMMVVTLVQFFLLLFLFTGGIFPEELKSSPVEVAFKYAVFSVNRERKLLGNNTTLVYRTLYYKNNDIFQASKIGESLDLNDKSWKGPALAIARLLLFHHH